MKLRLGTRASTLALTQSGLVAEALRAAGHDVEVVTIRTRGDSERGSLTALAGLGIFAAELRAALLDGECDFAVHSLKDLPVAAVPGLAVVAVPKRADPRDALCARDSFGLADLPPGSRVGTGSPRRVAQLRALRPDVDFVDIRGNVDTRLGRVAPGDLDAVVLAAAGLTRLGLGARITDLLPILPAPGQGALALEARADAGAVRAALLPLDDPATHAAVAAERATLAALGGGCAAPIGALASAVGGSIELRAGVFAADGLDSREVICSGSDPELLGEEAAERLVASGGGGVCDLGESRMSRLSEFHDETGLWPADTPSPTVFLPREAGDLGLQLSARGMRVLSAPILTTVPLPPQLGATSLAADWVAVTSARTVAVLAELGWRIPDGVRIAAVGPATAVALRESGYAVDLMPDGVSSATQLAAAFPEGPGSVVIPGSLLSSPALPDGLRAKGWRVAALPVYTVEAVTSVPDDIRQAWSEGAVDAVLVTSGSVARALDELLGWPDSLRVLALGAPTAAVLADLGVAAAVAPGQDTAALADALSSLLEKGQP